MATILQSLKVSNVRRTVERSPAQIRRMKLVGSIVEQCTAAKAKLNGDVYRVKVLRRIRDKVTGESVTAEREKRFRPCWWIAEDGKHYLEVRYGWKALEIAKGKSTIEVGDASNLIATLEILRDAAMVGEFDDQLNAVAPRTKTKKAAEKV
jgi:hypothetical protein